MVKLAAVVLLLTGSALAQDVASPNFAAQLTEMLQRGSSGHSPTPEEIQAVESESGLTDAAVAKQVVPLLTKALADPDVALRKYALAMMVGMQTLPDPPVAGAGAAPSAAPGPAPAAKGANAPVSSAPASYKSAVAAAFAPLIGPLGQRLIDEDPDNRSLAATDLGGFAPEPPPAVYVPLLAYLKRDDAVGPIGLAVVGDLLQFGKVSDETAAAIGRYLHRTDQTTAARVELVEAIAARSNQSQAVNKSLLAYLDSDDGSLRARVILSLPQLDLAPDVFNAMKARVADIASGGQDALPVVNAAKAITTCWTQVKMTSGCPAY